MFECADRVQRGLLLLAPEHDSQHFKPPKLSCHVDACHHLVAARHLTAVLFVPTHSSQVHSPCQPKSSYTISRASSYLRLGLQTLGRQGKRLHVIYKYKNDQCRPRRLALNIKGVPYRTEWVEYPDIEPLYKSLKICAPSTSSDRQYKYTLPVIQDPTYNTTIADSINIANYLDAKYPQKNQLLPNGSRATQEAFQEARKRIVVERLAPIMIQQAAKILNPRSEKYFRRTREAILGRKLEDMFDSNAGRDAQWDKVQEGYSIIASWLSKNDRSMFFMGEALSYADIINAASLLWVKAEFGSESEEWHRILGWQDGWWARYMAEFGKYEQVV